MVNAYTGIYAFSLSMDWISLFDLNTSPEYHSGLGDSKENARQLERAK